MVQMAKPIHIHVGSLWSFSSHLTAWKVAKKYCWERGKNYEKSSSNCI